MREAVDHLRRVLVQIGLLCRSYGEQGGRKDVGHQDRGTDHLDPIAADGVFRIISEDLPLAEYGLFVENLTQNLQSIVLGQFVLIQIIEQQFQPIDNLISVQLEILRAILEQMYEILDNIVHLDELDLIGDMLLQISVRLRRAAALLLIRPEIDEQKLEQFGHDTEKLIVELIIELVVELLIGGALERLDDIIYRFSD